jgi:uncharacterized protein (DUF362 family)
MYGDDPSSMVPTILDYIQLEKMIPKDAAIGIKPNLVVSKPSRSGATTDPRIVGAVIAYLQAHGFERIAVFESAWCGDCTKRAFEICGYREIEERYGVPLIDLKESSVRRMGADGMAIDVCLPALRTDFLINVPVLKAHSQTKLTCALKNLKGVIPDTEKQRFHSLGLHAPIAALARIVKCDLTIVDGIIGDLSHEEGGSPVQMNRIFVAEDPVLVDAYAAALLGFSQSEIGYISRAEALGVGRGRLDQTDVIQLNTPKEAATDTSAKRIADRYAHLIDAREACSPCYGSLVHALHRLAQREHLSSKGKIAIGQGFKGVPVRFGIGSCTRSGDRHLHGCPPTARQIVQFLETVISG